MLKYGMCIKKENDRKDDDNDDDDDDDGDDVQVFRVRVYQSQNKQARTQKECTYACVYMLVFEGNEGQGKLVSGRGR